MIQRVTLTNFKKFRDTTFDLKPSGISYLAGGNNSGKSTLLQALAVFAFCRVVLEMERGRESLLPGYTRQGCGLSDDEFAPVAIASLKHLWTNLKTQEPGAANGYILKIRCDWTDEAGNQKHLRMALALANDRLFIKADETNLTADDKIPEVAYLPPFAGMTSRENAMSGAERRAMIGRGLAGGVIRNVLYDLFAANERKRSDARGTSKKLKQSDLDRLRREDPWEILQQTLANIFNTQLEVANFNQQYHTAIKINTIKGQVVGGRFKRYPGYYARDLMSEGSGFLQWLSVYALALSDQGNPLLLDEPDAHLHPSLQTQLVQSLEDIVETTKKQVLLATHSTEILRWADHEAVLRFRGNGAKYLVGSDEKVSLFLGLGSDYSPKIDPLRRIGCMIIIENLSDYRLLQTFATVLGRPWPNVVPWAWTGGSKERKLLFQQLKTEIAGLRALSIRDRDDQELESVDRDTLRDKAFGADEDGLYLRVWRRRHIENYLMHPGAITRASGVPEDVVAELIAAHALVIPDNFTSKDVPAAICLAAGKQVIQDGPMSIKKAFGVQPIDIAKAMQPEEVCEDVLTLLDQLDALCAA